MVCKKMIHDIIFRFSIVLYLMLVGLLSDSTMDTPLFLIDVSNLVVIIFLTNVLRQLVPWEYGILLDCCFLMYLANQMGCDYMYFYNITKDFFEKIITKN